MTSQGWAPGQYLGAVDAPHAEFHTEANASHIRVMLKDDNLGIGAKKGSGVEQGECVGLDVFQTLLGRLNAKDEDEFEREQRSREDLKRAIYTERKWGSVRFVSGGFLIGDKIQDLIDGEAERIRRLDMAGSRDSSDSSDTDSDSGSESETTPEPVVVKEKKSKKSKKIVEIDIETSTVVLETESSSTSKSKKKRKLAEAEADEAAVKTKKSKKSKKEKSSRSDDSESKHSKKSKKEKRSKKEKKSEDDGASRSSKSKSKRSRDDAETAEPAAAVAAVPTPAAAAPRPILLGGRHAVRARNIEQKRLAATHTASLNEVSFVLWTSGRQKSRFAD